MFSVFENSALIDWSYKKKKSIELNILIINTKIKKKNKKTITKTTFSVMRILNTLYPLKEKKLLRIIKRRSGSVAVGREQSFV